MNRKQLKVQSDVESKSEPDKAYTENMSHYYKYLSEGTCGLESQDYAFSLYDDSYKKEIVEALLLSNAKFSDVQAVFGIKSEVLSIYSEIFFDTTKFLTRLDKLSYTENYSDEFGKALKIRALALGPEYLYHKYGGNDLNIDLQKKLLKQTYITHAYKAAEANFNGINSNTSKNSVEFAKLMIKAYEALEKFKEADNVNEDLVKILLDRDNQDGTGLVPGNIPDKDIV